MPRNLPLEPLWTSLGASYRETGGWELPAAFGALEKECGAALKSAVLFDLSWRGKLKVSGSDRIPVLHSLLTSDIQTLKAGGGCYSAFLTAQGKVVADMRVYLFEDSVLFDTEAGLQQKIAERLGRFIIMEDVRMEDAASDFCHFLLAGPLAAGILEKLCGGALPEEAFEHGEKNLGGRKVTVVKSGRPGIEGYEIFCKTAGGEAAAQILLSEAKPAGYDAWESLRIEAGFLRYGIDMSEEDTLPETGLDLFAASETKGCYPGQEVVARTNTYKGHAKKLLGFSAGCGWVPPAGSKLMCGEKEAGWITSSSPLLQEAETIMLGYLKKGFFESHGLLKIISGEKEAAVSVRTLPSRACL